MAKEQEDYDIQDYDIHTEASKVADSACDATPLMLRGLEQLLSRPEAQEPSVKVVLATSKQGVRRKLILVYSGNHYVLPFRVVFIDTRSSHQELNIFQYREVCDILPLKDIHHFELVAIKRKSYTYP